MAQRESRIAENLLPEPHIAGRRVSVLQIYELVAEAERSPGAVARQLTLDILDVHAALRYAEEHPEELERAREERAERAAELREQIARHRPDGVSPP